MKKRTLLFSVLLGVSASAMAQGSPMGCPQTQTFSYTGNTETWTVPAGVTTISFSMIGGAGASGTGATGGAGGQGAYLSGQMPVTPGEILFITVGGNASGNTGGFNGGGNGGSTSAGGGGGATDIRRNSTQLNDRILVAAGGGGGGASGCDAAAYAGGNGGNGNFGGFDGANHSLGAGGGLGGVVGAGGAAGPGCAGFLGSPGSVPNGGTPQNCCCYNAVSYPGGGGGGGGFVQGGGGGGGSAGTTTCAGNEKGGGGGGSGGSNYNISNITVSFASISSAAPSVYFCYSVPVMPSVNNVTITNNDFSPCQGSQQTLTVDGSLNDAADWKWYNNGNLVGTGSSYTFTCPIGTTSGLFQVRGEGGAIGTAATFYDVNLTYEALPNIVVLPSSGTYCGAVSPSVSGGVSYLWNDGSTTSSITITTLGSNQNVSVLGTDANGCTSNASATYTINAELLADVIYNSGTGILSANVSGGTAGTYTYQWYLNNVGTIVGATNNAYTPTTNGTYWVEVSDASNCFVIASSVEVTNVGVNTVSTSTFTMSPNPTTGVLVLNNLTIGKNFRLVNALGQLVKSFEATSAQMTIDISAQPAGTYFLQSEGQSVAVVKQ